MAPELPHNLYPGAALVATGLSLHGLRSGSLSRSGAAAAWAVGYAHLANPLKLFGVTMVVFYLIGSRATKYKATRKATLEDAVPGGRDAVQVLANSFPSLLCAIAFRLYASDSSPLAGLARRLVFATLGHFATCLGDTLASELGILSPSRPIHILTLRAVPPGTNGGVSPLGLLASAGGGLLMGLTMVADLAIEHPHEGPYGPLIAWGTAAGLLGSLLDSLLGASLQQTRYSTRDGRVITDHAVPRTEPGVVTIGPGRDVLSNSGVNFVTACTMAAAGWWVGGW